MKSAEAPLRKDTYIICRAARLLALKVAGLSQHYEDEGWC